MHEHIYSAGSIRDNVTRRYCECGETVASNHKTTFTGRNNDIEFYKAMAERYKI